MRADTKILVVGDWVVDEYWFLVKHNSDISSHTGTIHYRSANQPGEHLFDLCGAGHVMRVLETLKGRADKYQLYGLGEWAEHDTEFLKHLLHKGGTCRAPRAAYQMMPRFDDEPPAIELITLNPESATTRVIRQYHQEERGLVQINRVDWEFDRMHDIEPLPLANLPMPAAIDVIAVHDFAKGVISEELVRQLCDRYPEATWYVRSKFSNPPWMELIEERLELVVIGPELATKLNPWDTLLVNDTVNPLALRMAEGSPGKRVVLLSEKHEFVALLRGDEEQKGSSLCVTGHSEVGTPEFLQLGWTSAFFASLLYHLLANEDVDHPNLYAQAVEKADGLACIHIPRAMGVTMEPPRKPTVRGTTSWAEEDRQWRESRSGYGIVGEQVDGSEEEQLHVWRASPYLKNYIACIEKKQQIINDIGAALREFKRGGLRRSLSILLQADPGSGKTFLARMLAESFGFAFLRADVSQMVHRDELFDFFDTIATQQANDPARVLVFVDEINSKLAGSHVYGAFLAPLEEGVFVRRGKLFSLKPCAWIFAGTQGAPEAADKGEKLDDLTSRLTMIKRIDYGSLEQHYGLDNRKKLKAEAQLEQVYLAASIIRRYYSDVRFIAHEILTYFHDLNPSDGGAPRRIRKLVESMKNVQYGRVTAKNCDSWDDPPEAGDPPRMVRLEF